MVQTATSPIKIPYWLENLITEMNKPENFTAGLGRMLELACVSQNHLNREMKKHFGLTPTEFINSKRVVYASELVTENKLSVMEICGIYGFESPSNFYYNFRKIFDCTPNEFKKKAKNQYTEKYDNYGEEKPPKMFYNYKYRAFSEVFFMNIIHTDSFTANVLAYAPSLICIDINDGKTHANSKAILPFGETESKFTEVNDGFIFGTDSLSAKILKSTGLMTFFGNSHALTSCTYSKSSNTNGFELNISVTDGEHIYGLGQDNDIAFGRLDRRGTVRDMLTGQRINQNHVTADYPISFIISTGCGKPYGIYLDNTSNLNIDICCERSDNIRISAPDGACRIYIFSGDTIPEIVCKYSEITGRASLPPLWVLGYMQSKCSFWNWEEIDDVILTFAKKHIPLDSIVFDFDWAQYFNNYKWADRWEGKSAEKMKYYREKYGIHFMASNSGPMLKEDSDTFESAVNAGILAHDTEGNTVTCGHYSGKLMDFTNPETEKWLSPQIEKVMDDGIEAWWFDLTEPEGDAENTVYFEGSRGEVHNIFSNAVSDTYHNIMKKHSPEKRSFVLTRTGTAGIQRKPTAL